MLKYILKPVVHLSYKGAPLTDTNTGSTKLLVHLLVSDMNLGTISFKPKLYAQLGWTLQVSVCFTMSIMICAMRRCKYIYIYIDDEMSRISVDDIRGGIVYLCVREDRSAYH